MASDPSLGDAVRQLVNARDDADLYDAAVVVGKALLGADTCLVATASDDELVRQAQFPAPSEPSPKTLPMANNLVGQTYTIGRSVVVDDLQDRRSAAAASPPSGESSTHRSMLSVPIDGVGVFLALSTTPDAFSDAERVWAERFVAWLAAVLESQPKGTAADADEPRLETIAESLTRDLIDPLCVARGSVELAEETGESNHFDRAQIAIDRIESLTRSVAALAQRGDADGPADVVNLREEAMQAWALVDADDATCTVSENRALLADRRSLWLLLLALFGNAVDHAENGSASVRVGVLEPEDGFYVEVDRTGVDPDSFEPLHSTGDDRSGVEFHLVEAIAAAHHWDLTVSEGRDGGARFEFVVTSPD